MLVAGAHDDHARPACDQQVDAIDAGGDTQVIGAEPHPGFEGELALGQILPTPAHVLSWPRCHPKFDAAVAFAGFLPGEHGVGPRRQRGARENLAGVSRLELRQRRAGAAFPADGQPERRAPQDVGRPQRVAVHRAVVEARQRLARAHVFGQHAARGRP